MSGLVTHYGRLGIGGPARQRHRFTTASRACGNADDYAHRRAGRSGVSEHKAYASAIDYWQRMFAQLGRRRTKRACRPMASRKHVTRIKPVNNQGGLRKR